MGSQRLNNQPKKYTGRTEPIPILPHLVDMLLSLYVGPEQLEKGLSLKLLPICEIQSSNWAALSGLSGRGGA